MISHKHKIIFLHSGKTAGSAFEVMLDPQTRHLSPNVFHTGTFYGLHKIDGVAGFWQHATARLMKENLPAETWENYSKISIVRDPFERMYSYFHYDWKRSLRLYGTFEKFVMQIPELVETTDYRKCRLYMPQSHYCMLDGKYILDDLIRFETLHDDVKRIQEKYGIKRKLPVYNVYTNPKRDKKIPAVDHYTEEMKDVIIEVYEDDFAISRGEYHVED